MSTSGERLKTRRSLRLALVACVRARPAGILATALTLLWVAIVLGPITWTALSSLKSTQEIFNNPFLLPASPRLDTFRTAWVDAGIGGSFINSVVVTGVSVPTVVLVSALASYALARFAFPGRGLLTWFFVGGLMIPLLLGIVPLFDLLRQLRLLNTHLGLILANVAFQISFTIYLLYPFFRVLPRDYEDAALIDGCSRVGAFWRVMLPLAMPGLVSAAIFNFIVIWNEYTLALIILGDPEYRTLPVQIAQLMFRTKFLIDWGVLFAAVVTAAFPAFLVYVLFQRRIVSGLRVGAIKT